MVVILNADETQTGLAVANNFLLTIWILSLDHKFCCCCQLRQITQLQILIDCGLQGCQNKLAIAIFVTQKDAH